MPASDIWSRRLVLGASLAMLVVGSGGIFLIVVALKPMAESMAWPRSAPALAYSLQFLGAGVGSILMGHWLDRTGMRPPALTGAVMIGAGAVAASQASEPWQLWLVYGLMMGLFGQSTLISPLMANITRWYGRRSGRAVGIVASGQSLAGVIWPPVAGRLVETLGWRGTYIAYGLFAMATMIPLALALGAKPPAKPPAADERARRPGTFAERPNGRGEISPAYLQTMLCVAIVGCCVAMSMPLAHLVAHVSDTGYMAARGAEALSLALLAALLARIFLVGALADRYGGLSALIAFSVVQAAALALLTVADGLLWIFVVAALFGTGYGGLIPTYAVVIREHLPASEAGRRTGTVILFGAVGMAIGGWLAGYMHDLGHSYRLAFAIGLGFNLANLAVVVRLRAMTAGGAVAARD